MNNRDMYAAIYRRGYDDGRFDIMPDEDDWANEIYHEGWVDGFDWDRRDDEYSRMTLVCP